MEELRQQQQEALETAGEYCEKLINAIENVVKELEDQKLSDTDAYMESVIKGINWVIEVYMGTKEYISQLDVKIDKDVINSSVLRLNEAIANGDDKGKAEALKGDILGFIRKVKEAADAQGK